MPQLFVDDACPDEEDIAAFLRGRLAASRAHALEAHVSHCSACRRLLSALAHTVTGSHSPVDSIGPTLPVPSGNGETELPIGARIGRYVVLDWRGAGSMGVVYAARDPELDRKIALKVLSNDGAGPADRSPIHDLLLREAQAMAQLTHPNVVTVFDVGSFKGRVFIAMELVEGQTLTQWLRAARRAQTEIIAAFLAAGRGLAAAHAAGLIHRDFKPDNVLVGHDGRVCVTDFGLARRALREVLSRGTAEPADAASVTRTGMAGTLAYMAPEQYLGRNVDARADQYSFAVALYEALYGQRPFVQPWLSAAASGRVRAAPRGSSVPIALRHVLLRALSAAPDERYRSMNELLAAIAPGPRRSRGRLIGIAALLVAAAVAAAGGYAVHLRRDADQRAERVGRLRGLAPEMRTRLRSAHMLPLHDIRPAREEVRRAMRDVEHRLRTHTARDELALGSFVLGEGHRALGDAERALAAFEAAWAAGERGPQIDAALGDALGAAYESRLQQIEQTVSATRREAQIRAIETRYRDPAMAHLRAALAAGAGSPAYLEALMAFHDHQFAASSQGAHAAFAESPMFYEAGALEAKARNEVGRQLLAAGKLDDAGAELAAARRIFQRVLEIARSDDQAWLSYGEMVYIQANALGRGGEMPADLQQEAVSALRNAQRINPDNGNAFLREAQIHIGLGNMELIWYRDPGTHVDQALALLEQARAHGADPAGVDEFVASAHWERAGYQARHGIDPHAEYQLAIAAERSAIAARPDADKHQSLGVDQASLAAYDGEHGNDPAHDFELAERNFRTALAIDDDPGTHYGLAWLWTRVAHYQQDHGQSPQRAVDNALAEYEATARMNATRADAWAGMSDALTVRARSQRQQPADMQATLTRARAANERALAMDSNFAPAIKHRIMIAELDAEVRLERNTDPSSAVRQMRNDARLLSTRLPGDSFGHRQQCRADLLAARWALAHHAEVDPLLARATAEAKLAREHDALDALAWTASAEVELVRRDAARARGSAPSAAAVARGLELIDRALNIDPRRVHALKVRDALRE